MVTKRAKQSDFCPCTCTMLQLVRRINSTKKTGQLFESKFLEGVRHCRIVIAAATNGEIN